MLWKSAEKFDEDEKTIFVIFVKKCGRRERDE
jgi:hypothetical protein